MFQISSGNENMKFNRVILKKCKKMDKAPEKNDPGEK